MLFCHLKNCFVGYWVPSRDKKSREITFSLLSLGELNYPLHVPMDQSTCAQADLSIYHCHKRSVFLLP